MCPGIFSQEEKKTKHLITIITISKKPKLINYNNAPLTKANTLKKKKKSSKLNKIEKKKKKSGELKTTRGRGKRPRVSMWKEQTAFP